MWSAVFVHQSPSSQPHGIRPKPGLPVRPAPSTPNPSTWLCDSVLTQSHFPLPFISWLRFKKFIYSKLQLFVEPH